MEDSFGPWIIKLDRNEIFKKSILNLNHHETKLILTRYHFQLSSEPFKGSGPHCQSESNNHKGLRKTSNLKNKFMWRYCVSQPESNNDIKI